MSAGRQPERAVFDETIAAIITPPGEGGVAALRIAGADSRRIVERHFRPSMPSGPQPFLMRHGHFVSAAGEIIDEVLAVWMPEGRSYTGLDQMEIFCHGGRQVVRLIQDELLKSGARAAEPGEFTRLSFLHGRVDLARAEAVAELVAANTRRGYEVSREHLLGAYSDHLERLRAGLVEALADLEVAIDFAEEDISQADSQSVAAKLTAIGTQIGTLLDSYRGGRILTEGYRVAIAGRPNAGKSSLFNRLLRQERALVHHTAGTTRDYLSEWIDLDGYAVNLTDTAGLRREGDEIEKEGQVRAEQIIAQADLVLWIFDISLADWSDLLAADIKLLGNRPIILLGNKIDIVSKPPGNIAQAPGEILRISCLTGEGLDGLHRALLRRINEGMPDLTAGLVVTSARHQQKLAIAAKSVATALGLVGLGESPEIVAFELRQAVDAIDEITGRIYTEEILGEIFSRFCIGK